jgi:hypothetical protein
MPFMVLVYGPLGGCCNYTPVAPMSTSGEVCGTGDGTTEWLSTLPGEFPQCCAARVLSPKELVACSHSANG